MDGEGAPEHGYTAGEHYTLVTPSLGDGTWIRSATGGLWSDPLNWNGAVVADGAGRGVARHEDARRHQPTSREMSSIDALVSRPIGSPSSMADGPEAQRPRQ